MKKTYQFWIYIMASKSGTLYIGMTKDLKERYDLISGSPLAESEPFDILVTIGKK